jgi:hypothetical protein
MWIGDQEVTIKIKETLPCLPTVALTSLSRTFVECCDRACWPVVSSFSAREPAFLFSYTGCNSGDVHGNECVMELAGFNPEDGQINPISVYSIILVYIFGY